LTGHEWGRGAKAGLVAGGAWGIITAAETVATLSPIGTVLVLAILRLVWGFVLGLVFAAIADRFMSNRTYRAKGAVYGLVLAVIEIALNLGSLATGVTNVAINLAVGIPSSLVFGWLIGYSYERFGPTDVPAIQDPGLAARGVPPERRGRPYVPVIGWMWTSSPCSPTAQPQPAWCPPLRSVPR
jgi:hypothetical protein